MENLLENNQVTLVGEVATGFKYSHEVFGEGFYIFELAIVRESNYVDYIPVMVSERLIDINTDIRGRFVFLKGQYRSFNMKTEEKNKLILNAFALEIEVLDNDGLVDFAKFYANSLEYSIDEMGVLAIYTRISDMQTNEHAVTIKEVKCMVNDAIDRAEKKNVKHFVDVL